MSIHPLQYGAAYSKEEIIQGRKEPSSDTWMGLPNSMWINKALGGIPEDHPSCADMLRLLRENKRFSPRQPDLTEPKANGIPEREDSCMPEATANAPDEVVHERSSCLRNEESSGTDHNTVIASIVECPDPNPLHECLDETNTFAFDLRLSFGYQDFQQWMEEYPVESNIVRKISFQHWTWIFTEATSMWCDIDDESIFLLHTDGKVEAMRNQGRNQQERCHCDDEPSGKGEENDDENEAEASNQWTVSRFARALAQDDAELLRLASEFVTFIKFEEGKYEAICCKVCMLPMFYIRTSREREIELGLTHELSDCSSNTTQPSSHKSAARASRAFSFDGSDFSDEQVHKHHESSVTTLVDGWDNDEASWSPSFGSSAGTLIPANVGDIDLELSTAATSPYSSFDFADPSTTLKWNSGKGRSSQSAIESKEPRNRKTFPAETASDEQDSLLPRIESAPCTLKRSLAQRFSTKFSSMNLRGEHNSNADTSKSMETTCSGFDSRSTWPQQVSATRRGTGGLLKQKFLDRLKRM